ncbi:hypothetical protein Q8A67_004022 [Cirrhinus molitorella]|uniref:Uncharacterized protein n=1 Tax=Cirrhinus molitorella TaxID=172907 RepID=A0AA88Q937_9TELE|nr:hypothetical protein Q8A67_004022 [Cirrhinus molitorella]
MRSINYSIDAPDIVKGVAETFRKKLKKKTKFALNMPLRSAERRNKPSDIVLFFFPVVSRTGTDIDAAIKNINHSKPVILVVLHHTFDPEAVVSESKKFVKREHTLTVDCLFYEDKGLLQCKRNDKALAEAKEWLKSTKSELKKRRRSGQHKESSTKS